MMSKTALTALLFLTVSWGPVDADVHYRKGQTLTEMNKFGATSPVIENTMTSKSEFLMLMLLAGCLWVSEVSDFFGFYYEFKWRSIVTVFPTYQMWRGAYPDNEVAGEVCKVPGLRGFQVSAPSDISERDLQACFEDVKQSVEASRGQSNNVEDNYGMTVSGFHWFLKLAAVIKMVDVGVGYSTPAPMDFPVEPALPVGKCWEKIENALWAKTCKVDDFTSTSPLEWPDCVMMCAQSKLCKSLGLVAYNNYSKSCIVELDDANCKFEQGYRVYQHTDCPGRNQLSCGVMGASATARQGHFSNLDSSKATACDGSGLGHTCEVHCDNAYSTDQEWGHMAVCGMTADGNLRWKPNWDDGDNNAAQDMCAPDNIHRAPGLMFNLKSTDYTAGILKSTQTQSTIPKWQDKRASSNRHDQLHYVFSSKWLNSTATLESVGPVLAGHQRYQPLSFRRTTLGEPATYLRAAFPIDRLIQSKTLSMFAVLDPANTRDWLTFTSAFELERVIFTDGTTFGEDFINNITTKLPQIKQPGPLKVVTIMASIDGDLDRDQLADTATNPIENALRIVLRINGYPVYSLWGGEEVKTIAHGCRQSFAAGGTECAGVDTYAITADRFDQHGPCTASELFCMRTAITHARTFDDGETTYLGAAVTGDSVSGVNLEGFEGRMAEVAMFDMPMDVTKEGPSNLRRVESIEWWLATKYGQRKIFAPAKPPAPVVRKLSSMATMGQAGCIVSFPPQATMWPSAVVMLQVLNTRSSDWSTAGQIRIKPGAEMVHLFNPTVARGSTYVFRLVVQSVSDAPGVVGFASTAFDLA